MIVLGQSLINLSRFIEKKQRDNKIEFAKKKSTDGDSSDKSKATQRPKRRPVKQPKGDYASGYIPKGRRPKQTGAKPKKGSATELPELLDEIENPSGSGAIPPNQLNLNESSASLQSERGRKVFKEIADPWDGPAPSPAPRSTSTTSTKKQPLALPPTKQATGQPTQTRTAQPSAAPSTANTRRTANRPPANATVTVKSPSPSRSSASSSPPPPRSTVSPTARRSVQSILEQVRNKIPKKLAGRLAAAGIAIAAVPVAAAAITTFIRRRRSKRGKLIVEKVTLDNRKRRKT